MKRARLIATIIFIIAALSTIGTFLLPIPLAGKIPLSLGLIVAEMHTGACIIYFTSFGKFTRKLKQAYIFVCTASILVAAGTMQLLLVNALGFQYTPWVSWGGTELPFVLGLHIMYLGYSRFADLLGIKFAKWSPFLVAAIALLMLAIVPFLPHVPKIYPEPALDLAMTLSAMQTVALVSGVILVSIMKRRASPLYTPALAWTLLALIAGILATSQQFSEYLFLPDNHWYVTYRLYIIPIGISGVFSLLAALVFSAIPSASGLAIYQGGQLSFFGKRKAQGEERRLTLVDVVIFAAGLASNIRALTPSLDRVRAITSRLKAGESPTPEDEAVLADAYREIENYLITAEPVRRYEVAELRDLITSRFEGQVDAPQFWRLVTSTEQGHLAPV